MKPVLLLFILSNVTLVACAQYPNNETNFNGGFQKGNRTLTIGYGYGTYSLYFQNIWSELDNLLLFGPMYLKLEFGRHKHIGFAINGAYVESSYQENYYGNSVTSCQAFSIIAKWNYHFLLQKRTDLYFGTGVGYGYRLREDIVYDSADIISTSRDEMHSLAFETTLGLRYYLSNRVAIYSEFGIAKSILQGGLTFSF